MRGTRCSGTAPPSRGGMQTRARHARARLAAEELEVLRGDGAVARADLHRRALARVREVSASTPPVGRVRVGDRVDARDRALEHGQRVRGDVAVAPAAVAVAREAQDRALGRDRAVLRSSAPSSRGSPGPSSTSPDTRSTVKWRSCSVEPTKTCAAPSAPSRPCPGPAPRASRPGSSSAPGGGAAGRSGRACRRSRRAARARCRDECVDGRRAPIGTAVIA